MPVKAPQKKSTVIRKYGRFLFLTPPPKVRCGSVGPSSREMAAKIPLYLAKTNDITPHSSCKRVKFATFLTWGGNIKTSNKCWDSDRLEMFGIARVGAS